MSVRGPVDTPEQGPLSGLLVVDLTRVLAGPFATMMLADLGARVLKVERPGGDDSRGYGPFVPADAAGGRPRSLYFERVNHGKESLVADLTVAEDLALVRRLVARADVLVENFRPGVAARLGLGPDQLLARTRDWSTARSPASAIPGHGGSGRPMTRWCRRWRG